MAIKKKSKPTLKEMMAIMGKMMIHIETLKADGFRIFPYTINKEKRMEQLIQWGVTGIISDEPELVWKVIRKLGVD